MSISYVKRTSISATTKSLLAISAGIALLASSGCATSELLESGNQTRTQTTSVKQVLIQDQIVAFGRPAQALPNLPMAKMVIVGQNNSYVLTEGGTEMINLLTRLDPKNIHVDNDMTFYSPRNDGYFQGTMKLSYAKLKDEFVRSDYQFFLQNNGKECSLDSDTRMDAQRFCFNIPIKGGVYPAVSNLSLIESRYNALTKPYEITIYTNTTTQTTQNRGGAVDAAGKLVLLPFAFAFDVVTFPIQLLESANR